MPNEDELKTVRTLRELEDVVRTIPAFEPVVDPTIAAMIDASKEDEPAASVVPPDEPTQPSVREPLRLIPTEKQVAADVVELLEAALADARGEDSAKAVLVVVKYDRGQSDRTRVRFFGRAGDLLACAARGLHEVNLSIDEDE